MVKKNKKVSKNVCPDCESTMTYIRLKSGTHVCRSCGNEWPISKGKK